MLHPITPEKQKATKAGKARQTKAKLQRRQVWTSCIFNLKPDARVGRLESWPLLDSACFRVPPCAAERCARNLAEVKMRAAGGRADSVSWVGDLRFVWSYTEVVCLRTTWLSYQDVDTQTAFSNCIWLSKVSRTVKQNTEEEEGRGISNTFAIALTMDGLAGQR